MEKIATTTHVGDWSICQQEHKVREYHASMGKIYGKDRKRENWRCCACTQYVTRATATILCDKDKGVIDAWDPIFFAIRLLWYCQIALLAGYRLRQ